MQKFVSQKRIFITITDEKSVEKVNLNTDIFQLRNKGCKYYKEFGKREK